MVHTNLVVAMINTARSRSHDNVLRRLTREEQSNGMKKRKPGRYIVERADTHTHLAYGIFI